jgi:ubiquinone/menaquinone biosynthesis C-methylase UbiE
MDAKRLNALVHDREAAAYDDRFLIRYDGRIGAEVARELARVVGGPVRAGRALDLAAGTGYVAVGMAAAGLADQVHASDLSHGMLLRLRANAARAGVRVRAVLADAERLPYDDGSFDLVVARGALHHLPSPVDALREVRRVLAPGGTAVVLAEPTGPGERQVAALVGTLWRAVEAWRRLRGRSRDAERERWEMASMAANLHTFSPGDLERLARAAGFAEVRARTASWAWVLVLGVNYYLVGEFEALARSPLVRAGARLVADAAAAFDRVVADRAFPPSWRHTVQAVLR